MNVDEFGALEWKVTDLLFKDDKTGELRKFLVHRRDTLEPNRLVFGIDGRLDASPAA